MKLTNFSQLLCRKIANKGEDIQGLFDTLVCTSGTTDFCIYIFCSQFERVIDEKDAKDFTIDKYYYRLILRCVGNDNQRKNYRIDSGTLWDKLTKENTIIHQRMNKNAILKGVSGRVTLECELEFEFSGYYEVDLYVKKLTDDMAYESCEEMSVKDLDLVAINPFNVQIISKNSDAGN